MSEPLLSVVMPVFNADRYLDRALESVLTQGVESLEVICVDDGSSDNSGEILNGWASRDKRVRLLKQQNAGQGAARNRALGQAFGNYVVFVDADDQLLPGALKHLLARVGDSDVVVYDFVTLRNEGQLEGKRALHDEPAKVVPRDGLLRMMGVVWNKLVRRKWLEDVGVRFPEGMIYEDIPVHWKLIVLAERIRHLASRLYALRAHPGSTTAKAGARRLDGVRAFRIVEEFLRTSGKWLEYRDVFMECELRYLAQVYDSLSELGAESVARKAIEASLGPEQRASLHRLPLHWRDRDVFLSLDGHRIPRMRRQAFRRCRKAFRLLKRLLSKSR
jgi:glycosyltransferase involved in cell wall biosynthesis